jgi:hypothetical protein
MDSQNPDREWDSQSKIQNPKWYDNLGVKLPYKGR